MLLLSAFIEFIDSIIDARVVGVVAGVEDEDDAQFNK